MAPTENGKQEEFAAPRTYISDHQTKGARAVTAQDLEPHRSTLVERRLAEMAKLETGWNGYSASPPSPTAIRTAGRFAALVKAEPQTINPSAVGGVGFTYWVGQFELYVEFLNEAPVGLAIYSELEADEEKLPEEEVIEVNVDEAGLRELANFVLERLDA